MTTSEIMNVYCDESCHLERDNAAAMVLGAVWCPREEARSLNTQIALLKSKHNLSPFFEIKWGKVSSSKLAFYEALLDLFFQSAGLNFRAWIVPDKSILQHANYAQSHDDWYYKMYFNMLKVILRPNGQRIYHVYMDIKDTRSRAKLKKLHEVLANANYDFQREIVAKLQHVHSHDIGLLQLADLLIGAVSYAARQSTGSSAKLHLVEMIRERSGLTLTRNTLPSASKMNLCFWQPRTKDCDES
jgi:hypothetical protein